MGLLFPSDLTNPQGMALLEEAVGKRIQHQTDDT